MKNTIVVCMLSAFLFSSLSSVAQKYKEMMNDPNVNFYEVKKEAEAYFTKHGTGEGSGYKLYKRWEYMNEQRYAPTGNRMLKQPTRKFQVKMSGVSTADSADWTCLGPLNGNTFWGAGRVNYLAIDPNDQNIIWSAAATGGIWKSTDGAVTWTPVGDFNQNLGVSAIAIDPKNTSTVYVGTGDYDGGSSNSFGLIKTSDGGQTWQSTGLQFDYVTDGWPKISDVNINPDSTNQILVSSTKGLYISKDSGSTWNNILTAEVREIKRNPSNSEIVYLATGDHQIYRSIDGGDTWTPSMSGVGSDGSLFLLAVSPAAPHNLYVANLNYGSIEGFYVSYDNGETFIKKTSSMNVNDLVQLGYNDCLAVSSADSSLIMIGAVHLGRSTNGGESWTQISEWDDPHCDHHFLIFDSTGVFYTANDGGVWKSEDEGETWARCNGTFTAQQYYKIGENHYSPDVVIAGSQDNGFHYMSDNTWGQGNGGDAMDCIVDYNNPNKMVGLGFLGGSILTSTNGGVSWTVSYANSLGLPTNGGNWVTPIEIDPISPNTYYLGLSELWKSTDFCKSWRKLTNNLTSGTNITTISIFACNSNIIYVAAGAKLFRTTNGGVNWSSNLWPSTGSSGTITSIAISQSNSDEVWITKSGFADGYKVYYTTTGGVEWENVTRNLPNLPFNTIALQNDTANGTYAGCDEAVYYTNKHMNEWVPFNRNLPHAIVNELNIYAPAGVIRACTYGRGVWESPVIASQPANIISPDNTKVYYADGYSDTATITTNLFDEDIQTVWTSSPDTLHELRIDLKKNYWINGLIYLPDTSLEKHVNDFSIYISKDSTNWKRLVAEGNWDNDNSVKNQSIHPTEGRFLKLVGYPAEQNDIISIAGIKICGTEAIHPNADFELADTTYTIDGVINLTDLSTDGPIQWLWEFGDGGYASDQNPEHTYRRKGKYKIMLTASNDNGMDVAIKETYIVIEKSPDILEETAEKSGFELYPNPARESFTVDVSNLTGNEISEVHIYDLQGKLVYTVSSSNTQKLTVNTGNLRKYGNTFVVQVKSGGKMYSDKLVLMEYKMRKKEKNE